ncbi:hypothetical protein BKA65DRAFT_510347 [Rhexocercosporidium sp. MPI-PUGE-AT-0058]|nr:hypothetical protein BKA65DRAFT_510347 [Rhexocercosporidium sp. MPI-PUGE-AT-0058]
MAAQQHPLLASTKAAGQRMSVFGISFRGLTKQSDVNEARKSAPRKTPKISRVRKLYQSLGLESVFLLIQKIRGGSGVEEEKIVILHDFRTAFYVSLLHILPAATAITLLVLNWRGAYIGSELSGTRGQDNLKFLGLQFAAKMLELTAVASLSCIMFALIRHQLFHGGMPFSAITSGFEFSKISLLWSREFAATCSTGFKSLPEKYLLISSTVIFTLIAATIGPSAAVAALPVRQDWKAGGTTFYVDKNFQELYPSVLDVFPSSEKACTSFQNDSCFGSNHNLIAAELLSYWPSIRALPPNFNLGQLMPENTLIAGRQALHKLAVRFRGPFIFTPEITVTTTPSSIISDALSTTARFWGLANADFCSSRRSPSFCYYSDIFYSIDALQPITFVKCNQNIINDTLQFPRLDKSSDFPLVSLENHTLGSMDWFASSTKNRTTTNLTWINLPETTFGSSSLGAVVALPGDKSIDIPELVLSCTIDARWANATVVASFLGGPMVVSGIPKEWFGKGRLKKRKSELVWPQVKISPTWAQHLDTILGEPELSAFQILSNSVGKSSGLSRAHSPVEAVEAIISIMVTEGMARIQSTAVIQGPLVGPNRLQWTRQLLPAKGVFGPGGSAFNFTPAVDDQSVKFEMKTTVNGYGYGPTTATILSSIVLAVYVLIAFIFLIYSMVFSQTTSSSWDSITELVALAMNSTPSSALHNTGAGIACLRTLKQPVTVGVAGDCLQLIFKGDESEENHGDIAGIAENTYYG